MQTPSVSSSGHVRLMPGPAADCRRVVLSDPERRNAMSAAMWRDLAEHAEALAGDKALRVVILSGEGPDFCSGANLAEFGALRSAAEATEAYNAAVRRAMAALAALPCPLVAEIRGVCMGAGLAMAALADLRLIAEDSRLAIPAARLGVAYDPDWVARLVGVSNVYWVAEMILTAREYAGAEAIHRGFGGEAVAPAALAERAAGLAARLARFAPLTLRATKAALNAAPDLPADKLARARSLARACDESDDYRNAVAAFAKGGRVEFKGR